MRVIVISDMEGVAGISRWDQVSYGKEAYQEGRRLYTEEINAAVRGARAGGATEIVVMDCHGAGGDGSFNSLVAEDLDPGCEFVVQQEWTEYTDFLRDGCDAALFVAMHSRAGTAFGVQSHTVSGTNWHNLYFNGTLVGETGINAALCGHFGVPVLLVTGDTQACAEAKELLGERLTTVAVKTGLGRYSARHLAPQRARELIEAGARTALADLRAVPPYDPGHPCEIRVEYNHADGVERHRRRVAPGVEVVDARTLVSRADDWWTAWRQFYF